MRFIGILFLLGFLVSGIFAQSGAVLEGQVLNSATPERNARVRLVSLVRAGNQFETITDDNGNFSFRNIANEKYRIYAGVNAPELGMLTVWVDEQIIDLESDQSKTITLQVQMAYTQIKETVNVSADTNQPFSEVSKTVSIIDADEVTNRNEITLTDTLRTIPGFRVQQLGGFGRLASIKTRGLRNQDTAILIDGIRFRDPAAINGDASPFLSDFSTANIGRVEVLRGSGSSVYGTNAIGGVIDFQTPTPQKEFNGSFLSEYGGLGMTRFRGDVGSGTADGKLGFTTGFSKTRFTRGIDGDDDADNLNLQGRVDYNPSVNTNISGRLYFSDAFVRLNGNPDTFGTVPSGQIIDANKGVNFIVDQNDPDNFQRSDFFSGQLALTQIFNPKAVFSASYQGLKTKRDNENGVLGAGFQPFGGPQFSTFDGQIHTLNTKVNLTPVRNNLLTIGYEYEFEKYGNDGFDSNPGSDFFARVNQSSNTIFAQNLLGLFNDKLQLAGGFRVQFFNLDDPAFSVNNAPYENLTLDNPPNAYTFDGAASYYFAKTGTKIRGHIGNGYRVPSAYERFGTFYSSFSQDFTAIGNPYLEPERSIAFDTGIEQGFMKNRVRLTATYFYTKLTNTIGYGNVVPAIDTTPRPFGGYENTKGGIARGTELSGQFKATDSTDIFASYTFTNSDQRRPQVGGSGIIQSLGIPENQFTLVATQRIGKRIFVNFDYVASSSYLAPIFSNTTFSTILYRFDGSNRGDFSGRYNFVTLREKYNFNIFGTVQNIFDNEYFENGFRTEGVTGRIGLGLNF